jgi:transcriptional regulator with AAA-type ATPase domain/polyferredoxin
MTLSMHDQDTTWLNPATTVLFQGVGVDEAAKILQAGSRLKFASGEYIYRQGDDKRSFYLVLAGEVELTINVTANRQVVVGHIGAGGHFGETSLLTGNPNGVSALALTPVHLLCYGADLFEKLFLINPTIHRKLSATLAKRLRVSFTDHANALRLEPSSTSTAARILDNTYLSAEDNDSNGSFFQQRPGLRTVESTIAKQLSRAVALFANRTGPLLILGESGTGRRLVAYEIHKAGAHRDGPFEEVDIRAMAPGSLEGELCGYEQDSDAFSQVANLGLLERTRGGSLVLYNAECLTVESQQLLAGILRTNTFRKAGAGRPLALQTRLIFICRDDSELENGDAKLITELADLLKKDQFRVAPLRQHRRDIPRLVDFYRKRFNRQYDKEIPSVDDQTLAIFMNYDWPGNLAEMSSVMQRAVIIGKSHVPLKHNIMLGMPKPEGKWEYNLLRLPFIKRFLTSRFFPAVLRAGVGVFLVVLLLLLLLGPQESEKNMGLTLSWIIGWPLLIFAFFFLARIWCSICGLSVPGWIAQHLLKPQRQTPQFIRRYSGWLMATLCILLFWVEITWNAYESTHLTAGIILAVTSGALFFSIFFKRRVWCRYLCPLGAINALFSMPSVLELRANNHVCMNRCGDYACYSGEDGENGCPMFRHPFLVDNNRDCILCGQCIKNCKLNSVHLNVRLAPQELWNQQSPRLSDSMLVVSLAAVFFPFVIKQHHSPWLDQWHQLAPSLPETVQAPVMTSVLFFGCIGVYLLGYAGLTAILAKLTNNRWQQTAALLGYTMIPLVLGAFMAAHLEIFVAGIHRLPENLNDLFGLQIQVGQGRILDQEATKILQLITICGALIASLYATHRIAQRLMERKQYPPGLFWLPGSLLCISALIYFLLL